MKSGSIRSYWPLLVILALAAALRLYRLDACTLWTDELFSLQSSAGRGFWVEELPRGQVMGPAPRPTSLVDAGPVWAIYPTQQTDTNPPVFYMALRVWRALFGDSTTAMRSLSTIATLAAVAAMYVAGRAMGGRKIAVLSGLLCAFSATQIIYAHEVRGYAMGCAFATIAAAALLRIERDGVTRMRLITLATAATLAIGTVYLAALPVLAMGIHAAVSLRGRARASTLVAGGAILALTLLFVGPLLLQQRHYLGLRNQWMNAEDPRALTTVASEAAIKVATQIAPVQERSEGLAQGLGAALLLAAIPLYVFVGASRLWLVWVALCMGALMAMDVVGQKTHLQWLRYTMLAGPGVIGLVASLGTVRYKFTWLIPAAVLMFAALSLPATYDVERANKEDWSTLQKFARSAGTSEKDLWLVAAFGKRRWDHILYLGLSRYLPTPTFRAAIVDDPAQGTAAFGAVLAREDRIIVFAEPGTDPTKLVPSGWRAGQTALFPTVGTLTVYTHP